MKILKLLLLLLALGPLFYTCLNEPRDGYRRPRRILVRPGYYRPYYGINPYYNNWYWGGYGCVRPPCVYPYGPYSPYYYRPAAAVTVGPFGVFI